MSEKKKSSKTNASNAYDEADKSNRPGKKDTKNVDDGFSTWQTALTNQAPDQSEVDSIPGNWLESLKQQSSEFLDDYTGGRLSQIRQAELNKQAIEVTVDRLFTCMQGFAYEFNKVAAGTDLHVSGTMSGDVKEVLQFNKYREAEETQTFFRARLTTRLYTLGIRGGGNLIDCFVMPVNHAMALSNLEKEYNPLVTIEIKTEEEGIVWRSLAEEPNFNSLEELCAWLFQCLIDQTKEAITLRSRGYS